MSLQAIFSAVLSFIVESVKRVTLLATLFSIFICLVMFFVHFFGGSPFYALLSLIAMLCFVYVNRAY